MEEKKDTHTNSNAVYTAILITGGLLIVIYGLNNVVADEDKFDSAVWGTVNDWFMYLVTIVTAVFVYRTLESQRKVQSDQEQINRITTFDLRTKYRADIVSDSINHHRYVMPFTLETFNFTIKENEAVNITVSSPQKFTIDTIQTIDKYEDERYQSYITRLSLDRVVNVTFAQSEIDKFNQIIDGGDFDSSKDTLTYAKIRFDYTDNFSFKYSKAFEIDYYWKTETLMVYESNIEYIDTKINPS